jgi:hypothetical protein
LFRISTATAISFGHAEKRVEPAQEFVRARKCCALEVSELQDTAEQLVSEKPDRGGKFLYLGGAIEQNFLVRDGLRHLQAKAESLWSLIVPASNHPRGRRPVKRAVYLNDAKALGVVHDSTYQPRR